jgi:hypothetical protein
MTLLLILLGAWMGGTLFMFMVAALNFRTVDRVLLHPTLQARRVLAMIPESVRRPALRHLVSELNRLFFRVWGAAQLVLALLVLVLLAARGSGRFGLGTGIALLAIVGVELFVLVPPLVRLGRVMDFLPRDSPPPQMAHFKRLHAAYSVLDLSKLALLVLLAWLIR